MAVARLTKYVSHMYKYYLLYIFYVSGIFIYVDDIYVR
jgi:hypothetical protein